MGFRIVHVYGLTETYGPYSVNAYRAEDLGGDDRSAKQARQGVGMICADRMRVVDKDMNDVPATVATLGEVVMRGNNVMKGYWEDPDVHREGVRGRLVPLRRPRRDAPRRLRGAARPRQGRRDLRRREHLDDRGGAGRRVAPRGAGGGRHRGADEQWGERPKAFVVLSEGESATPDELIEHVKTKIARYKAPRDVEIVEALPKTSTGKVQKFELREKEWGERTSRVN
jgi:fatty-acyl-CoA synthase